MKRTETTHEKTVGVCVTFTETELTQLQRVSHVDSKVGAVRWAVREVIEHAHD